MIDYFQFYINTFDIFFILYRISCVYYILISNQIIYKIELIENKNITLTLIAQAKFTIQIFVNYTA